MTITAADAWAFVARYWWLPLSLGLLGGLAGWGYAETRTPVYSADATGFVGSGASADVGTASLSDTLAKSRIGSYVGIATSDRTAREAARLLGIDASPAALSSRITISQPPDTVLLQVTATGGTPQEARDLAGAWVKATAKEIATVEDPKGNSPQALRLIPWQPAALPSAPSYPNPRKTAGNGALLGIACGVGLGLWRRQNDRRLRDSDTISDSFAVPVLGALPRTKGLSSQAGGVLPASFVEPLAKIRSNLQYMNVSQPARAIVISSPLPADGKSTVAIHLAEALAATGERVVLIDADLRRSGLAERMGVTEGVGLTDVIMERASIVDVLQEIPGHPTLSLLAAGPAPPNPAEMVGSRAMADLIADLSQYALVIIDSPPLLPVTDAAVLSANADGIVIVASAGRTKEADLKLALGNIEAVNGRVLGVVLNWTSKATGGYYHHYSSYYGREPTAGAIAPTTEAELDEPGSSAKPHRLRRGKHQSEAE